MAKTESNPVTEQTLGDETTPASVKQAPLEWERPSTGVKLAYAAPYFATAAMVAPLTIELKIFYTDTILVPAGLLALAMAIARAFDAITDPVMGWITDHTRSRWGRRKPWIPLGVPLSALFFWLMFAPPRSMSIDSGVVVWAGVTFCLYYIFHTIWAVPYHGLGLELTPDYDDRTSVFGYRSIVGGIGLTLSFILLYYIKARGVFSDERQMLSMLTGFLALIMIVLFIIPLLKVKENPEFSGRKRSPLIPGVRRALRNRPFQIILFAVIIGSIPATMPPLLMPYFAKYVLVLDDRWRVIFAGTYVFAGFLSLPVWMLAARHLGKLRVWMIAAGIGIVSSFVMFTVGEGQITKMIILELIRGFGVGSMAILGPAMLADVIDYDELRTGKRREAQFGSFLSLLPKFVSILAATIPLAVLGAVGYDPTMASLSAGSVLTIRVLFALFPVTFHIIVFIIIMRYPISRDVHKAIREGIEHHRQGEKAHDPITDETLLPVDAQVVDEDTGWFLDNFSLRELRSIVESGPDGLVRRVLIPVIRAALVCIGAICAAIWLLHDSLSMSQADQLRQGVASCLVVVAGLALTVTLYHLMRIRPAKKITAEPVDAETIRNHLGNI